MLLEPGDPIRYHGLGAGVVTRHVERQFQGQMRVFAVISFPHRSMTVQLPIGDPGVSRKLAKVLPEAQVRDLLNSLDKPGRRMARTWDQREEHGERALKHGEPDDWAGLLRGYVSARRDGMSVCASDADLVREACALLAAELSASARSSYADALAEVMACYEKGSPEVAGGP